MVRPGWEQSPRASRVGPARPPRVEVFQRCFDVGFVSSDASPALPWQSTKASDLETVARGKFGNF